MTVSVLPHGPGLAQVVCEAEALNTPLRVVRRRAAVPSTDRAVDGVPVVEVSDRRVAVSAVKLADDDSGDLVVRLWEATGDRVDLTLVADRRIASAARTNLLEEPLGEPSDGSAAPFVSAEGEVGLEVRPFELVTLRLQAIEV